MKILKLSLFSFLFQGALAAVTTEEEIRLRLEQWPKSLQEKDLSSACSLFAPNLVATYPDAPDRNYKQMCEHLDKVINNQDTSFAYEAPEIEEIIVDEHIAVVRLIWTLQTTHLKTGKKELIKERGLDVFEKQPDGSWRIHISYAYPLNTKT